MSISLDDGTHISWWPQGGDVRDYPFGTTKIPIYSAPAYSDQSLQDDIAFEGRPPDTIIHLDNLDEAAIAAWWAKYTDDMTWKTLSKNCATTVADALKAGGGDIWAPNFSKPTFLWSPADVKAYAEAIQAGGPGGP